MRYISHTAHSQFLGLVFGFLAWIIMLATVGLNEWRLWYVEETLVISSGVAWVGIWRACFYSHSLSQIENCWSMRISDSFVPIEIMVAQVLMVLAVICGLAGNISGALAMRKAYFSMENRRNIRLFFLLAGSLYVLTAVLCLVPLAMNMNSVINNSTINFPPEFHLPAAPIRQQVGSAIGVGLFASILMLLSGLFFLCYRYAWRALKPEASRNTRASLHGPQTNTTLRQESRMANGDHRGRDNPAFDREDIS